MKAITTLIIAILISKLGQAHSFTAGSYAGNGAWRSNNESGTYKTSTIIEKGEIKTSYQLSDGSTKEWNFQIKELTNGFFELSSKGVQLGKGYCVENARVCHYQVTVGSLNIEETLVQEGHKFYKFGSKDEGHGPISWQESLVLDQAQ